MYIVQGEASQTYCKQYMAEVFPQKSTYLLDSHTKINQLFAQFSSHYAGLRMEDLLPAVQFASKYYEVAFTYESPSVLKSHLHSVLNVIKADLEFN